MPEAAAVTLKIADEPQVRAILDGAAVALRHFGYLSAGEREALPEAARAGITALRDACAAGNAAPPRDLTPYSSIIIEWTAPHDDGRPMRGCLTCVYDAATGEQMLNVSRIRMIDVDTSSFITADLTMFAGEDGSPAAVPHVRDGEIITGTFRFGVSGMRVSGGHSGQ